MGTVDIGAEEFTVYSLEDDALDEADIYFTGSLHADTWRSATDDEKARALVTASRLLDRQTWVGDVAVAGQALAWPRSGTGITGVEDDAIPTKVVHAAFELALALLDGSAVQTEGNTSQKIESLRAGSVQITYFRGAEGGPNRFPQITHELLFGFLAGSTSALAGILVSGVDGESVTGKAYGYTRGF